MPAPALDEADPVAVDVAADAPPLSKDVQKLAKRMDVVWGKSIAQKNAASEEENWDRIISDQTNTGVIAALLLSMIGPFAVEFPDIMTQQGDWKSEIYVAGMGCAMIFALWATFASFINFLGLNLVPKTKTYEYMAKLGGLQGVQGTTMILSGILFSCSWLIYISKLMPGAATWICCSITVIMWLFFAFHYGTLHFFILKGVYPMSGEELSEKNAHAISREKIA